LGELLWRDQRTELPKSHFQLNLPRSGKQTHERFNLGSGGLDRVRGIGELLSMSFVAQSESADSILDSRASGAKRGLKVPGCMRFECGCGDASQIGRKSRRPRPVIQHEGALTPQSANEQSEFKQNIVARHRIFRAAGDSEVILREDEHGEVKPFECQYQRF
jgi:hypothetical protein